jgi:hypothetical protein
MRTLIAILISACFATTALAQTACEIQTVGKDGKPLSGAAKTSAVNNCKKDACEPKAVAAMESRSSGRRKAAS